MDYLLSFSQSKAILGGTPVRQQLCIIDSLWAKKGGPMGAPDKRLSRLVMGTFSPAVDYATARQIREPLLGAKHPNLDKLLSAFGYGKNDSTPLIDVNS